ncbi:hypothetical protein BDR07DRAFT_1613632 [Suillus spraguei]|nr:hypothetical protein BDR07DRAFT_1613632 [Suillus spraguei]
MSLHLDQLHGMLLWKTIPSHRPQVNATHTQPSTYPQYESRFRTNLGVEASTNIMGPVDHNIPNSRPWNGGARAPFLQGPGDTHTDTQHYTGNTRLIYDHSPPRTMPSNINENQNAYPHTFLATPSVPLIYDLRFPPTYLTFPSTSPYASCGYEQLFAIDVGPDPSAGEEGVTCLDVLTYLHAALQRPLADTEWGTAGDNKRASLIRARDRRSMIQPGLQASSDSAALPALTARSVPGANVLDSRLVQREPLLLRVDWHGSRVAFMGLIKDEAFARSRLIPGGGQPPETWVVKSKRL